ncbi:hypothetical protein ACS0TY_034865 [Phlomoides rotata]
MICPPHQQRYNNEDELVVYTNADDFRLATVLMRKSDTGEESFRYTCGLFTETQATTWHINEKELFAVWNTSGVKEGEISLRPQKGPKQVNTNVPGVKSCWFFNNTCEKLLKGMKFKPEHFITDVSGKYLRLWALKGVNPNDVRRRYEFGVLASSCTITPGFREISELPDCVLNAVVESWHNNPHLKRYKRKEKRVSLSRLPLHYGRRPFFSSVRPAGSLLSQVRSPLCFQPLSPSEILAVSSPISDPTPLLTSPPRRLPPIVLGLRPGPPSDPATTARRVAADDRNKRLDPCSPLPLLVHPSSLMGQRLVSPIRHHAYGVRLEERIALLGGNFHLEIWRSGRYIDRDGT